MCYVERGISKNCNLQNCFCENNGVELGILCGLKVSRKCYENVTAMAVATTTEAEDCG